MIKLKITWKKFSEICPHSYDYNGRRCLIPRHNLACSEKCTQKNCPLLVRDKE